MKQALFVLAVLIFLLSTAHAQVVVTVVQEITCPADGTSIELAPARTTRAGYMVINSSDADIRYGFVDSGTPDLDATNSVVIKAGNAPSDNVPMVSTGRMVCMSTTAGSKVVGIIEKYRP